MSGPRESPPEAGADLELLSLQAVLVLQLLAAQEGALHPALRERKRHLGRLAPALLLLQHSQHLPLTRQLLQQLHTADEGGL